MIIQARDRFVLQEVCNHLTLQSTPVSPSFYASPLFGYFCTRDSMVIMFSGRLVFQYRESALASSPKSLLRQFPCPS